MVPYIKFNEKKQAGPKRNFEYKFGLKRIHFLKGWGGLKRNSYSGRCGWFKKKKKI